MEFHYKNFSFGIFRVQAKLQISDKLRSSREDLDVSLSSSSKKNAVSVPYGTLGVNRDQWGPSVDAADRERFDAVLEKVLAELEPIALQEQQFCINFFQMDVISPSAKSANLDVMEKSMDMSQSLLLSPSSTTGGGDGTYAACTSTYSYR